MKNYKPFPFSSQRPIQTTMLATAILLATGCASNSTNTEQLANIDQPTEYQQPEADTGTAMLDTINTPNHVEQADNMDNNAQEQETTAPQITEATTADASTSADQPQHQETAEPQKDNTMTTLIIQDTPVVNTELNAKGINIAPTDKKVDVAQLLTDKMIRPKQRVFHFASNQNKLTPEAMKILKQHANYLLQNPTLTLNINGHTDARGDSKYNLALSEKRANSVKKALMDMGVPENRLHIFAWGEDYPVKNAKNYAENRRIELEYSIQNYAANDDLETNIH